MAERAEQVEGGNRIKGRFAPFSMSS